MTYDPKQVALIRRVLSNPELYPDEFKTWLQNQTQSVQISSSQLSTLPQTYQDHALIISASGGGSPTIGNGTQTARFIRLGRMIHYWGAITLGSTTSFGTGTLQLSMPISCRGAYQRLGDGSTYDASAATGYDVQPEQNGLAAQFVMRLGVNLVSGSAAIPHAWAVGDQVYWNLVYEAA